MRDWPTAKSANVDHLLHFTEALRQDLAVLQRHEGAKVRLARPQRLAEQAHGLAPFRRRYGAPMRCGGRSRTHDLLVIRGSGAVHRRNELAVGGTLDRNRLAVGCARPALRAGPGARMDTIDLEAREQGLNVHAAHRAATGESLRWRPALPDTTTSAERSFVPP